MEIGHDRSTRGEENTDVLQNAMNDVSLSDTNHVQNEKGPNETSPATCDPDLESWNPMAEDYSNLAFNGYRDPTTEELRQWIPKQGSSGPSEDLMACYRSKDGDVRLFVNGIPIDVTQEGVKGLFSQVGKVAYCRVIPQKDPSRSDKFGFVGYNTYREAEHAIRKFDGFSLGNNMKLKVNLSKEKPKLPRMFPAMESDFTHINGLEEKLENNNLDWGPPATPLNLTPHEDGDPTADQHKDLMVPEKVVNTEAMGCDGEVQHTSTVQESIKPTSKRPIAAVLEPLPCSKCGKEGRHRCGNCKAPYCSKECQRSHWPEHKEFCNWKTNEKEQGKTGPTSNFSAEENMPSNPPPSSSPTVDPDVGKSNESEAQNSSKPESNPSQDPYSLHDEDLEFSEVAEFANLFGIRVLPKSPRESPSPKDISANQREHSGSPLPSPQESHYGHLKPFKKASPTPLITEITSSVSSESEPVMAEVQAEGSTTHNDQTAMSIGTSSSVTVTQSEEQSTMTTQPRPYKRYYIDEAPHENVSIGGLYEIVGTSVSSPTLFWAQLYESSALESQTFLFETIKAEYENTAYRAYVPSPKELCVAQYSLDNNWYRSKVDYIGNNGLIRVTHIDFGSSEDVDPSKIRRIKEELVRVPRQAIKCAVHLPERSQLSTQWSPETVEVFKSKVLDVKCQVEVKDIKDSIIYLEVYDSIDNTKINVLLKEKLEKTGLPKPVPVYPQSSQMLASNEACEEVSTLTNSNGPCELLGEPSELPSLGNPNQNVALSDSDTSFATLQSAAQASMNAENQISGISREGDVNPILQKSSVVVETFKASRTVCEDTALLPPKSPATATIDSGFKTIEPQTQESQNFHIEMQTSQETLYKRPISLSNGEPDNKANGNNVDERMSGRESPGSTLEESISSRSSSKSNSELELQLKSLELSTPQNASVLHGLPRKPHGNNADEQRSGQESPSSSSERSLASCSSSKSSSELDLQYKCPEPSTLRNKYPEPSTPQNNGVVHGLPFKAVVTWVKSPWEFTVKLSGSQFVSKLDSLTHDLNTYCSTAPFDSEKVYSFGDTCAVKHNEDLKWHRGKVLANFLQEGYKIYLVDLGIVEIIAADNLRSIPDQFKELEPQARQCSLGGVRKPARSLIWGKVASERFSSLVLNKSFMLKEIIKYKQAHVVELLDETGQPSVATELINAGLADAFVNKVQKLPNAKETNKPMRANYLHFKNAIDAASLPPQNATFQIMATEIQTPGLFFVQLVDKEANKKLSELRTEMTKYYADSTPHPDWQPRETELCAALLKGSWFRVHLESVDESNAAKIYCVDFGNSEVVSASVLRPLAPTFQTLPYCAIRCSLGNIVPLRGGEWQKEAMDFLKSKIPMSSTLNARLIYKGQGILFVDVFVSCGKSTESMLQLLVAKGLATYKSKKEFNSPSSTAGVWKDRTEDKLGPHKTGYLPYSLSVYGCAIAAARLPNDSETFEAVVTEVISSGEMYIHVADEALAVQLIELTNGMNSFYSKANPTQFEAKQNILCAAKFSTNWRRSYILEVNSDETANVYDVDFGKTEVLHVSRLQFLQPQFTALQYFALRCKLQIPRSMSWSKAASELFLSKIKILVPVTLKLSAKRKEIMFVDVLMPESEPSLSQLIQNHERRHVRNVDGANVAYDQRSRRTPDTKSLNFEKAIAAVTLPPEKQVFSAVVTEFQTPQCFYIHSDVGMAMKLTNLSADMNSHYNTIPRSPFQAMESQLCVAPFGSPNEWYRALVEKISTDKIATVFFVDYGNTDEVPVADLRPLEDRFSSLPYSALHASLANVKPVDSAVWPRNAIDFVKSKIGVGIGLALKLVTKGQRTLFVDLEDPSSGGASLCDDLVNKGMACYSPVNGEQSPYRSRSFPSNKKTSLPIESAIAMAKLPPLRETFQVIASHVTSPGTFAVQIADYEMACKLAALSKQMNAHYQSAKCPPLQPASNQLYAAQFTGNDEWYRGWIDGIISDDKVHAYYVDYGNSEDIDVSRLRPLEKQFTALPFSALSCSIAHVIPQDQGKWKQEAIDMFTSKVPLYHPFNVKLGLKRRDCLFLDILDPDNSSTTISKSLVEQGLAVWIQPSKKQPNETNNDFQARPQYDESKKDRLAPNDMSNTPRETLPGATAQALSSPANYKMQESQTQITSILPSIKKHLLESIPMAYVPKGEFLNGMVCDIKKTGAVSLQVLTKELKELDELCMKICSHCSQIDHSPYCPVVGELCLACFSQDQNWYRAVVNDILPNNQYRVTFVDFGNDDTPSSSDIRKIEADFLRLPRQAYTGYLAGLPGHKAKEFLEDEMLKAYNEKLLDKRVFVRINGSGCEFEFFNVGLDEKPGSCINEELLNKSTKNNTENTQSILTDVENEFMALVSEVVGTGDIWVQRKDAVTSLNSLKEDLTSYCESSSSMTLTTAPSPGHVCLSKFSIDKKWYRAKVIANKSHNDILVKFLDYGNTAEVSVGDLRQANPEFLKFPFQGIKCYLVGVTQGNPDADEYVQQTINRELMVKVCERRAEELGIELEDYGVPNGPFNINENLIAFGYSA